MFAGVSFLITSGNTEAIVLATAEKLLNVFVHIYINRQNSNSRKKCLEAEEKGLVFDLKNKQENQKNNSAQRTQFFSTATLGLWQGVFPVCRMKMLCLSCHYPLQSLPVSGTAMWYSHCLV